MGNSYHTILETLFGTISERKNADPLSSYTASLFHKGTKKIAQKVGEEGVETALAAMEGNKANLTAESADLIYHLLVLWVHQGVTPDDVLQELQRRHGTSGLDEKANREKK